MEADAFTYVVVDVNPKMQEYTIKNCKTGEIRVISKDDFDFYTSEANNPARRSRRVAPVLARKP